MGEERTYSVVIEGLDGVGKSTVCQQLAKVLGAKLFKTPPQRLTPFRRYFDDVGGDIRHGYYLTGNFMVGEEMREAVENGRIAVCDRYYATTQAYNLAKKDLDVPIPSPESAPEGTYKLPHGLYQPDYMVLLTLDETIRLQRLSGRIDVEETAEEAHLRQKEILGERINQVYKNFGCHEISAAASVDDIVNAIIEYIKNAKHH
jgi:thymidylate kinase